MSEPERWADIPIVNDEWTAEIWNRCPFCGDDQLEGGSFDVHGTEVSAEVWCINCTQAWTDVYRARARVIEVKY